MFFLVLCFWHNFELGLEHWRMDILLNGMQHKMAEFIQTKPE